MTMTQGDYFDNNDVLMEDFFILPLGLHDAGTYSLPSGMSFSDLEYMEGGLTTTAATNQDTLESSKFIKEQIAAYPTSFKWTIQTPVGADTNAVLQITAINNHQFTLGKGSWGNERLRYLKGYRKRYATENVSKVVNVFGSGVNGNIKINDRIEIDIASQLGSDYLNATKLEISVEIFRDDAGATLYQGWAEPTPQHLYGGSPAYQTYAIDAVRTGGKILIWTGDVGLVHDRWMNAWANTGGNVITTEAPCRILVTKVDKMVASQGSPSGGVTEHELFKTTAINSIGALSMNDDMSQYDMLELLCYYANTGANPNDYYLRSYQVRPEDILNPFMPGITDFKLIHEESSTSNEYIRLGIDIPQSNANTLFITRSSSGWAEGGVQRVIGIKRNDPAALIPNGGGSPAPVALTGALASAFSSSTGDRDSNYDPTDFNSTNYTEWWSQTKDIATYAYGEGGLMSATPKTFQDVLSVNTLILVDVFSHKWSNHEAKLSFELLDTYGNVLMGIDATGANGKVTTRYGADLANLTHTAGAESSAQFRGVIELLPDGVKFSPSFNHVPNEAPTGNWYTSSFTRVLDTSLVRGIRIAECSANAQGSSKAASLLRTFPKPV